MTLFFLKDYQRNLSLIVLTFFISLCLAIVFNIFGPIGSFGAIALLLFIYLFIVKFEIMFLAFLIFRPVFDMVFGYGLSASRSTLNLASVVSIIFIAAALLFILRQKKSINLPSGVKFYSIFLIFATISTIFNFNIVEFDGLFSCFRLITVFFVMLIILLEFNTAKKIEKLFKVLICSTIVPVFFAIVQIFTGIGTKFSEGFWRINGGFAHPNVFGMYLSIFIIMVYAMLMLKSNVNIRNKRLLWIVELVLMICLLLTYGRGALLSSGVVILLITLFYIRKKNLLFFCIPSMILVILCFYMSGASFFNIGERFEDVKVWETTNVLYEKSNSLGWRIQYWKELLTKAFKSPIIGYGLGSVVHIGSCHMESHNNYIHIFVETGMGVFFYFLAILMFFKKAFKCVKEANNSQKYFFVGVIGIIFFYLINSFSAHLIRNTTLQIYFFSFLTMVNCSDKLKFKNSQLKNQPLLRE